MATLVVSVNALMPAHVATLPDKAVLTQTLQRAAQPVTVIGYVSRIPACDAGQSNAP